jgi:cell division protein FtsI/penicillin-binding protein 2
MRASPGLEQGQQWRLLVVAAGISIFAALILQKLVWYQVVDRERIAMLASAEHQDRRELPAKRGSLLDARGYPLATTVLYDAIYVGPNPIPEPARTAAVLSLLLNIPMEQIEAKIAAATTRPQLIADRVPASTIEQVEAAKLRGIEIRRTAVRDYPEGNVAAQTLGFTGVDGQGLSGLELTYENELAGRKGYVWTERDPAGSEIALGRRGFLPPVPGADLLLTVDRYIQRIAERELAEAVRENKATGGVAIIMEPATGAILAMASLPSFDVAARTPYEANAQDLYKPVMVTDTYEPGSVMKLVTLAAALNENVVNPSTPFFDSGIATINGVSIRNWDGSARGNVTVREIIRYSLNTGSQWMAGLVGPDRFYSYLDAFGFGKPTGVRLNGEAAGHFRRPGDAGWSQLDLATNSYGQSITVTPLQMITAVAALANNGVLVQPQLVREMHRADGTHVVAPVERRAVVTPETARTAVQIMEFTWNQPALQTQHIPGYRLAAKSGTADIPGDGRYNVNKTYASFVGFGPLPDPRFVILVRIDRPEALYGGVVAAPVFRAIASELITYLGIPPDALRPGQQGAQ